MSPFCLSITGSSSATLLNGCKTRKGGRRDRGEREERGRREGGEREGDVVLVLLFQNVALCHSFRLALYNSAILPAAPLNTTYTACLYGSAHRGIALCRIRGGSNVNR